MDERVTELLDSYSHATTSVAAVVCDDHPADGLAYVVVHPDLTATELTYGQLKQRSEQFAAGLAKQGVQAGDRVATLMGKGVDYLVALVGIWRLGAVHVPLFTAFAAPAIEMRLASRTARACPR